MSDLFKEIQNHTIFINLNERPDRLKHVKNELSKLNIVGFRFPALKTANGAVGCSLSHIKCMEIAKLNKYPYVFICEDDITFLNPNDLKERIIKFGNTENLKNFDVLIISGNNLPPHLQVNDFCIKISNCQCTTGYIVAEHYYDTLINNFKESAELLIKYNDKQQYAIDMYWKKLQYPGNWYMIYPPTVTQYENYSDVENKTTNYHMLMLDVEKEWLFKDMFKNFKNNN